MSLAWHLQYYSTMTITGKVKWVDSRDAEGVATDFEGNEYYFNQSVCPLFDFMNRAESIVTFELKSFGDQQVACNVSRVYGA